MQMLKITAGPYTFTGRLELENAPKTCAAFIKALPFSSKAIHVRWSGEAVWLPLQRTWMILYPGGISETEILLAYGGVHFASKMGQLAGNHFLTIVDGLENVAKLGVKTLWDGAQPILFEAM
jgi:hypothetical protein